MTAKVKGCEFHTTHC